YRQMNLRRIRHFRDIHGDLAHRRRHSFERRARVDPDRFCINAKNGSTAKTDDGSAEHEASGAADRRLEAPLEFVVSRTAIFQPSLEAARPMFVDEGDDGVERFVNAPEVMDIDDLRSRPRAL